MQNEGGCEFVLRLPRETKVDVEFVPRLPRETSPSATPATQEAPSAMSATPDTQIVCERWYVTNWCVKDGM